MRFVVLAMGAVVFSSTCSAAITSFFTNRSAWEAAVGSFSTETFETAPVGALPVGTTQLGTVSFTYPGPAHSSAQIEDRATGNLLSGIVGIDGSPFFGDLPAYNDITFQWAATAFGADWFSASSAGQLVLTINGATVNLPTYLPGEGNGFFGFISDTAFTTLRITPLTTNVGNPGEIYEIDNVSFNLAVPEPGAYVTLISGLGIVLALRRRAGRTA